MSDLTLDQAKTILFSAADASSAFSSLSEFGYEVKRIGTTHFLYVGSHAVMFFDGKVSHTLWIFIDDVLFKHQILLESQQQPAATVPTVAAVEAHSCPPQYDNYGSPFELITCAHCGLSSFKSFLSENGVHLICLYCNRGEWLGFRNQLSTQSVDKAGE